jgi:hypothetical protein
LKAQQFPINVTNARAGWFSKTAGFKERKFERNAAGGLTIHRP